MKKPLALASVSMLALAGAALMGVSASAHGLAALAHPRPVIVTGSLLSATAAAPAIPATAPTEKTARHAAPGARAHSAPVNRCMVASGDSGDAPLNAALLGTANADSLDLTAISLARDGANLTATFQVVKLADPSGTQPMIWGDGNVYNLDVTGPDGKDFWFGPEIGASAALDRSPGRLDYYVYGHYEHGSAATSATTVTDGYGTGSFDLAASTMTMSIPLSAVHLAGGGKLKVTAAGSGWYGGVPRTQTTEDNVYSPGNSALTAVYAAADGAYGTLTGLPTVGPVIAQNGPGTPSSQLPPRLIHGFSFYADKGMSAVNDFQIGTGCVAKRH